LRCRFYLLSPGGVLTCCAAGFSSICPPFLSAICHFPRVAVCEDGGDLFCWRSDQISRPVTLRGVGVLFAAGVQERGSELGSVVADFVAVAGGGNEACVAEGEQVA
jgi:hypothetical protein